MKLIYIAEEKFEGGGGEGKGGGEFVYLLLYSEKS